MLKRNYKDIVGGGLIAALGVYVLITALQFGIGAASRMGAGYYPMLLGIAAIGLGSAIAFLGLREQTERPRIAIKPFIAVVAGLLAFFLLVDRAGMIPAVWGLTGLSSLADEDMHVFSIIGLMLFVSIAAWLLFSVALGLPIAGIEGVF